MHPRKTQSARRTWREGKSFGSLTFAQSLRLVANRMDPFSSLIPTLCCESLCGFRRVCGAMARTAWIFLCLIIQAAELSIHTCHRAATDQCVPHIFHLGKVWSSWRVSVPGLVSGGFDPQQGYTKDCENTHCLSAWNWNWGGGWLDLKPNDSRARHR